MGSVSFNTATRGNKYLKRCALLAILSCICGGGLEGQSVTTPVPPRLMGDGLPPAVTGATYSQAVRAVGTAPMTWAITAGSLPPGLKLVGTSGSITGVPTTAGTFSFTVVVTNPAGTGAKQYAISVTAPPVITSAANLPMALTGISYSQALHATGTMPMTWSIASGALPSGLTLGSSTGSISGTPASSGTFTATVKATNGAGSSSAQFSLTVNTLPAITTPSLLPSALTGLAYSQTLKATGTIPMTWAVTAGALPSGLTLAPSTGSITGTPTVAGVSSLTVKATNPAGSVSQTLSLTVKAPSTPPSITTTTLPSALAGTNYSQTLTASGTSPITWAVQSGSLPPGITLSASSGIVSGVPTQSGAFSATVSATNAGGADSTQISITVNSTAAWPIGINMSEAEYSWGSFPAANDLSFILSNNLRLVRLPTAWERIQPALYGPLDTTYLSSMKQFITMAGGQGVQVIVDVHNYGRYNSQWAQDAAANYGYVAVGQGNVIGSTAVPTTAFTDLWTKLAGALKGTPGLAYYDIMNEPYNMGAATVWPSIAQAAVNAIRTSDTRTTILVEGTQWASAFWWPYDNGSLNITDPGNNFMYEAHLYFDGDGSGTYAQTYAQQGAYPTIGVDHLQPFLTWIKQHNARGFLGEFGIPNNDPNWLPVLDNFLTALQAAGMSGTYWNYAFHSPNDPSWWPTADTKSIIIGQANPAVSVLSAHNAP